MCAWLLGAALAAVTAAAPVDLQRAEDLMAQYKYAEARTALTKARTAKGLDRASLLRILELQGLAAAQMRQAAPATAAFRELLTLDPGHKLGGDYAPRVMTPFFEAGQAVTEQGALEFRALPAETSPKTVTGLAVEVGKDPLKMARSVVFHVREGGSWRAEPAPLAAGKATLALSSGEVSWWAELLGDNDSQLVLAGSETAPQIASPPAPVVLAPPEPKLVPPPPPMVTAPAPGAPVRTASYVVLGGAVLAAGAGTIFGIKSSGELSSITKAQRDGSGVITGLTERQAASAGADAARDGTIANVCFIGAGALAVGGALMFFLGAPVAVAPGPGGVVVSGRLP
jgi:hypothetical protein